ncbi:hypothetical protein Nepgr_007794 [Nepenthes gracilis]|uniref:Uncharacterized protein n=1 Tax=Nepenthes gracilis TaxID=150966 RepID=A0AAD3XIN6_NEPGR|nr:hypothetical protein Nepgr_007794 [Nepenthes gracilis]
MEPIKPHYSKNRDDRSPRHYCTLELTPALLMGSVRIQDPQATQSWNQQYQQHHSTLDSINFFRHQHLLNTIRLSDNQQGGCNTPANNMPPKINDSRSAAKFPVWKGQFPPPVKAATSIA